MLREILIVTLLIILLLHIRTVNDGSTGNVTPTRLIPNSLMNPTLTPGVVVMNNGLRVNICEIAAISLTGNNTFASLGLTFLTNLPEPTDESCEGGCESAIRAALIELNGQNVGINAGGETFNGVVFANQVFVGVVNQGGNHAITTCHIGFINP